jgi:amino acid permease
MIQRIQTVYLFIIFAIGLILGWQDPVYAWFDGENQPSSYVLMFWNSYSGTAPGQPIVYVADLMSIVLSLSVMSLSIVSIFLFKNRRFQMRMVLSTLMLCGLLICVLFARYVIFKSGHPAFVGHLGFSLIWPVLMSFSAILAYRAIKSDDEMVRSMDRIR